MTTPAPKPLRIFCSYAHEDEAYVGALRTSLRPLERQGLIEWWHDREIIPGQEWRDAIDENLQAADIILFLITPDFMASDFAYEEEIPQAIARHERREASVIPVIARPADWEWTSFGKLQALPKDAKPITRWPDPDDAWLDVERGIRRAIEKLNEGAVREHVREVSSPDLRATAMECLNLLYGIAEANARVLGRIEANYTTWRDLADDNYNSVCQRCEDVRQQPIGSDQYLDTVCDSIDVDAVCKRKWYLGERLEEYKRVIDRQPGSSQDHSRVQQ